MNLENAALVFILSLAVSSISMTITKAKVFSGLRDWISRHNKWLGELFQCPYCMSHWVSFAAVLIYRPVMIARVFVVDLICSAFVIITLAAFVSGLIFRAFKPMED